MQEIQLPAIEIIAHEVIHRAYRHIEEQYGTGHGDGKEPQNYHNLEHTIGVVEATKLLAKKALEANKISNEDYFLCQIAAAFHDWDFKNEAISNETAISVLRQLNLSEESIGKVSEMIMATINRLGPDGIIQSASIGASHSLLACIVADADLFALGSQTPIYWESAYRLLLEMRHGQPPSRDELIKYLKGQGKVLNRKYLTDEANAIFTHKLENNTWVKTQLSNLKDSHYQLPLPKGIQNLNPVYRY